MRPRISWMAGAAVAAAAIAASVALASAQVPEGPTHGTRGARDGSRLAAALELTEQQQATWKELHQKRQAEMKAHREQGMTLRHALREAVDAANPDAATIGRATLALKKHQQEAKASRDALRKELEATLTEEQKTKFEAIQALRTGHGRHGRRGPGGRGFGQPHSDD